tara:strand:+ start:398 stop:1135 length:738 start_codon:yes stop_codon:yes gene_type:complete
MCDPVSITLGVVSAGLGIVQQQQAVAAQNEQIAFQNAQAQQNYAFAQMQAQSQRAHESQQRQLQEDMMMQNEFFANAAFESDIALLNQQLLQEQAKAGHEKRGAAREALERMGEVQAAGRVGNTIGTLLADYRRQQAYFDFATSQNLAFTAAQTKEGKRAAQIERGGRIASQQPYLERTILDPIKPLNRPSARGPGFVGIASSVVSGVGTGLSTASAIKGAGYTYGKPPAGSTAKRNFLGYYRSP